MLYIAENLKSLRKGKDLTQEEMAEMIGVSAQSVSKWERGDTYPDITLLPALANIFKTSVDALIGMDKINDVQARATIFTEGHDRLRSGDNDGAASVYVEALKTFPNDEGIMSELALVLALGSNSEQLKRAVTLCERVLSSNPSEGVRHTTRAALCFIYLKIGEKEMALEAAQKLPHIRESRETVLAQFEKEPSAGDIDDYLRFIALGESDEQDIITVDLGRNMLSVATEHNLTERIHELRDIERKSKAGYRTLPHVRVRDNSSLSPNQVRVRYYADYLLDQSFSNPGETVNEIIKVLQKIAQY